MGKNQRKCSRRANVSVLSLNDKNMFLENKVRKTF